MMTTSDNTRWPPPDSDIIKDYFAQHPPDITLIVDDRHITCHKNVLCKHSQYFQAMFSIDMQESNQSQVHLHDINADTVQLLVANAYTKDIRIDETNVCDVITGASMLQFDAVIRRCSYYLDKTINTHNCLLVMVVCEALPVPQIYNLARRYALWYYNQLLQTDQFVELPVECFVSYLNDSMLHTSSELNVFAGAVRWLKHNAPDRWQYGDRVLDTVRLQDLTVAQINKLLDHPYTNTQPTWKEKVLHRSQYLQAQCEPDISKSGKHRSRRVPHMLWRIGGTMSYYDHKEWASDISQLKLKDGTAGMQLSVDGKKEATNAALHDKTQDNAMDLSKIKPIGDNGQSLSIKDANQFSQSLPMDGLSLANGSSANGSHVQGTSSRYIMGTRAATLATQTNGTAAAKSYLMEQYIADTQRHRYQLTPTSSSLEPSSSTTAECSSRPTSVVTHDAVYSGYTDTCGHTLVTTVPTLEQSLEEEVTGHMACMIGMDLYVCGGEKGLGRNQWILDVYRYATLRGTWTRVCTLLQPRRHHVAIGWDTYLYVIGGFGKHRIIQDSVHCYNTSTDVWEKRPPLSSPVYSAGACVCNDRLYVIRHSVEYLERDGHAWTTVKLDLPFGIGIKSCVSVDNCIYISGTFKRGIYRYDTTNGSVCKMSEFRHACGPLAAIDRSVYNVAGEESDCVECYNIDTQRVTCVATLEAITHNHCVLSVPVYPDFRKVA